MKFSAFPAILVALLVIALAVRREQGPRAHLSQQVIRLDQAALNADADLELAWSETAARDRERPLLKNYFPRHTWEWVFLPSRDAGLSGVKPIKAYGVDRVLTENEECLSFRRGQGVLTKVLAVEPHQPLQIEIVGRVLARSQTEDLAPPAAILTVVPLKRVVDLSSQLKQQRLIDLWQDPKRQLLCYGKPPPVVTSGPFKTTHEWQRIRFVFRAPLDAHALLLEFYSGENPDWQVDLQEISVTPFSLRNLIELEETIKSDQPLSLRPMDDKTTPAAMRVSAGVFGIESLVPSTPISVVCAIDCLSEQRPGFLLPPPAEVSLEVSLPSGPLKLEFAHARLHELRPRWRRDPITLLSWIETAAGEEHLIFEEEISPGQQTGWVEHEVELSRYAGQRVRLHFATESERSLDCLAVGSPLVRRVAPFDPRPNVILVSLDTVRADHFSCEGYERATTPFLDELARESVWCRQAYSTSSYTLPSHASMMSGQSPTLHGVKSRRPGENLISSASSDLIAVRLQEEGYLTAGFTGGHYVGPAFGFAEGFDRYSSIDPLLPEAAPPWHLNPLHHRLEFNLEHRKSRDFDAVLEWIREHRDGRFFLFLHTFLVHEYTPSPAYQGMFGNGDRSEFLRFKGNKKLDARELSAADLQAGIDAYDETLREADEAMQNLVSFLRQQGLWENTIFILTSDHGEEFLDHGRLGHGRTLRQEMLRVPFLMHIPGLKEGLVIDTNVSLTDLTPTLFDLLGLGARLPMDGQSLLPRIVQDGVPALDPLVLAELDLTKDNLWRAAIRGSWKLVEFTDETDSDQPQLELKLYDLKKDPKEKNNLAENQQSEASMLARQLRQRLQQAQDQRNILSSGDAHSISYEMLQRLGALGYLEEGDLPDSLIDSPDEMTEITNGNSSDG